MIWKKVVDIHQCCEANRPCQCLSRFWKPSWRPALGRGGLHIKGAGMLVVSLRVVNFGFWSHLGCSGLNAIIFSHKRLIQGCTWRNITKLFIFNLLYFLDSCNQSFKWSFLGVKKGWAMSRLVSFRGLIQNFRRASPPLSYGSLPPGLDK